MSEANGDNLDFLVGRLRELMEQWRCTAKVLRPIDVDGAVAHLECAEELQQILNGDLSPIAKWTDPPNIPICDNQAPDRGGKDAT